MTNLELRLFLRSYRWLPPTIIVLTWVLLTMNPGGPWLTRASPLFPAYLLLGAWATISLGNLFDPPTRDVLAARAGSSRRQHKTVILAVIVATAPLVFLPTAYALLGAADDRARVAIGILISCSTGVSIGISIGTWLHRPIVANRSVTIFGAFFAVTGVMLIPPLTASLRALADRNLQPMVIVAMFGAALLILSAHLAGSLAERRAVRD